MLRKGSGPDHKWFYRPDKRAFGLKVNDIDLKIPDCDLICFFLCVCVCVCICVHMYVNRSVVSDSL